MFLMCINIKFILSQPLLVLYQQVTTTCSPAYAQYALRIHLLNVLSLITHCLSCPVHHTHCHLQSLLHRAEAGQMDHPPTSARCHDWAWHHVQRHWRLVTAQLLRDCLLQECYGGVHISRPVRLDHCLLCSASLHHSGEGMPVCKLRCKAMF